MFPSTRPLAGCRFTKAQTGVVDTGLPGGIRELLPETKKRTGDDKSVDLALGFGPFQMRVQVASYTSADPQEKVEAFYRKALASYGNVLLCRGNAAVGNPDRTEQGLTCSDKDHGPRYEPEATMVNCSSRPGRSASST